MLLILRRECTVAEREEVVQRVVDMGLIAHPVRLDDHHVIGVSRDAGPIDPGPLAALPGVEQVMSLERPYPLASREIKAARTSVSVGGVSVGGPDLAIIAGPCAVEDESMLVDLAAALQSHGADMLRGGAYKPRSSPYSFQGLGIRGLEMLARAREATGMPVVTEVLDEDSLAAAVDHADMLQVGARNMHNYAFLRKVARTGMPVFLKRGMSASLEEFLLAAEYLLSSGNPEVVLCERGVRTFSNHSRFTLDLSVIPAVREESHLPIVVDPSHATGLSLRVPPMARAAVAAGADGVMIEVHPDPAAALSDGQQSLTVASFSELARQLRAIAALVASRPETVP